MIFRSTKNERVVIVLITLINITQLYPDLFTDIVVPDGMDAKLIVDAIMEKYGMLTPVYPEPQLFHAMIISFFNRRQWNYQKLFDTLNFEYNPLENLNREDATTHSETEKETEDNTTNTTENGTTDNSISAYNTSDYSNDSKQDTEYNSDISTDNRRERGIEYIHTVSSHGTIGVITNQDMIGKEREVSKFNLYDYIADDFQAEFLLGLW